MKRKILKKVARDFAEGFVLAAVVIAMFFGVVKINAAGADTELPEEYQQYCEETGQAYGICPELLMAVIEQESGGNPDAVGAAGEIGLMQIYPKWHMDRAESLGVYSLFSPRGNILVGADYLVELFAEYGDIGTVLMVYNGEPDAVELGEQGRYTEYARKVMERSRQLERLHKK